MTDTNRVALKVGGQVFDRWTEIQVVRNLSEISGSFHLTYLDTARVARATGTAQPSPAFNELDCGQEARIEIDGELVLLGWIDSVELVDEPGTIGATVSGRDRTGDLVDCAAAPQGPAELRNVTLLEIAQKLAKPFGIAVRSEVEASAQHFDRFSIDVAETAMSAIEKATRQSAVLLVSDGVGGLVLTKSGINRAPADLKRGDNITGAHASFHWQRRFSDYWYKGQQERNGHSRTGGPALDSTVAPLGSGIPAPVARQPQGEKRGVIRTGHAVDPEVTRYRPHVRLVRTESAGASAQEQADWLMRVARGESEGITYSVADWRASSDNRLWRPNELTRVVDRYAGIDRDMLIAGVTYSYGARGSRTDLRVVGPEAFDRIQEDARRRRNHHDAQKPAANLDSSVSPLFTP